MQIFWEFPKDCLNISIAFLLIFFDLYDLNLWHFINKLMRAIKMLSSACGSPRWLLNIEITIDPLTPFATIDYFILRKRIWKPFTRNMSRIIIIIISINLKWKNVKTNRIRSRRGLSVVKSKNDIYELFKKFGGDFGKIFTTNV